MPNPRIIRALELIHDAKQYVADLDSSPGLDLYPLPGLLNEAEAELHRHLAEVAREEHLRRTAMAYTSLLREMTK